MASVGEHLDEFENEVRRRNLRETLAIAAVLVVFAVSLVQFWLGGLRDPLLIGGLVEIEVAGAAIAGVLWTYGRVRALDRGLPAEALQATFRAEVERHARLLTLAPVWYVAPIFAGIVCFFLGVARQVGKPLPVALYLGVVAVGVGIAVLNVWSGRELRRRAVL